jgi:hypothetical protein
LSKKSTFFISKIPSTVRPQSLNLSALIFLLSVNLIPPLFILVVPVKAPLPIVVAPSAEIVVKAVDPLKASAPIDVTVIGNVIEVVVFLSLKAPSATVVAPTKSVSTKTPFQEARDVDIEFL